MYLHLLKLCHTLNDLYSQVTRDRSAVSLNITQATTQQITNANLANFCYQAWLRLSKIEEEQGSAVYSSLESSVQVCLCLQETVHCLMMPLQNLRKAFEGIVDPLISAIRRELGYIIAKLHRIDFAKKSEPGMGGPSSYIKELTEKLSFVKSEILARYSLGDFERTWYVTLGCVRLI